VNFKVKFALDQIAFVSKRLCDLIENVEAGKEAGMTSF
jgi:hypothetical protein